MLSHRLRHRCYGDNESMLGLLCLLTPRAATCMQHAPEQEEHVARRGCVSAAQRGLYVALHTALDSRLEEVAVGPLLDQVVLLFPFLISNTASNSRLEGVAVGLRLDEVILLLNDRARRPLARLLHLACTADDAAGAF
jgi:hypothetical protein